MATNFGTKTAMNAHKCIYTRDNENAITYNWVNGLRGVATATKFWPRGQKNHRNGHNFSCKRHIHAEFGFEIGYVPSGNSSVTLPYTGQRGITMATNFGTKIAINAYKCISTTDNENEITYNGVFLVDQFKEDISGCKGLSGIAKATKFWPK